MADIKDFVAKNLKERRKAKGLTQAELADLAKVSLHTILRAEKKKALPQSLSMRSIATALGCEPEDLFKDPAKNNAPTTVSQLLRIIEEQDAKIKILSRTNPLSELISQLPEEMQNTLRGMVEEMVQNFNLDKGSKKKSKA